MLQILKKTTGFSLIEILVVVGLMAILINIAMAEYGKFNRRQKLEQAARELVSNLRQVQNNALIGKKSYGSSSCSTTTLYGWEANLNSKTYYGLCCSDSSCSSRTSFPASNQPSLISNSTFTITSSTSLITFFPVTGETNLVSDLNITISDGTNSKTIKVTKRGLVNLIE